MTSLPKKLQRKLHVREAENALRKLPEPEDQIDFSSNDYLGFANDEDIYASTFQYLLGRNISQNGSTGSRLISGNHSLYTELENFLATFHQTEGVLIFNSGYDANIGFFGTVPQRDDIIFYDEFVHASIRDGIKMGNAKSYKFKHNDLADLKLGIERSRNVVGERSRNAVGEQSRPELYIVTESVFSMDGDSPDLKNLAAFCSNENIRLIVDEAHAIGVFGRKGVGLVQALDLQSKVFARIVTFGKALGCHGAAILGERSLISYLVNFARSFIYTTALPPHTVATIFSAYTQLGIAKGQARQKALQDNILLFRSKLELLDLARHFIKSDSAIQGCIVSGNEKAKALSKKLADDGFCAKAILAPTVPKGQERLRFCLHSFNTKEEIGLVLQLLKSQL